MYGNNQEIEYSKLSDPLTSLNDDSKVGSKVLMLKTRWVYLYMWQRKLKPRHIYTLKVLKSSWIWKSKYKTFEVHDIVCLLAQWSQMIMKVYEKYISGKMLKFVNKGTSCNLDEKMGQMDEEIAIIILSI